MTKYVLKRIGISIVTVFVLVSVVFFLARLMPGGPFNDPKLSETAKANLSAYYGFDKPLWEQYLTYLSNLLHGNFGFSTKYPSRTVNDLLAGAFPYSADLGIRALCFAISFGLVFGIISALNRGNKIDLFFVIVAVIGTSVPDFIMGAILQHFFAISFIILPCQFKSLHRSSCSVRSTELRNLQNRNSRKLLHIFHTQKHSYRLYGLCRSPYTPSLFG